MQLSTAEQQCSSTQTDASPGNIAQMVSAGFKTLALPSSAFAPTLAKLQQQTNRFEVRVAVVAVWVQARALLLSTSIRTYRTPASFFRFFREKSEHVHVCTINSRAYSSTAVSTGSTFEHVLRAGVGSIHTYMCARLWSWPREVHHSLGVLVLSGENEKMRLDRSIGLGLWLSSCLFSLVCFRCFCFPSVCAAVSSVVCVLCTCCHHEKRLTGSSHDAATYTHKARVVKPATHAGVFLCHSCHGVSLRQAVCPRIFLLHITRTE